MDVISSTWILEEDDKYYCYWPKYASATQQRRLVEFHGEADIEKSVKCAINIKYKSSKFLNFLKLNILTIKPIFDK